MKNLPFMTIVSLFISLATAGLGTLFFSYQPVEDKTEVQAVEAAIADYVEGIYEVDSTRIERSVHPELRKRGYWFHSKSESYRDDLDMTFKELRHLAATWNQSGERANNESIKKIEVYDVNDRTASAKLTAVWGIDYFHLAKYDEGWKIVNVLWQSLPTVKG